MSLYQIVGMVRAIEKRNKKPGDGAPMSDGEFDALKEAVRAMNLPDVRIH